MRATGDGDKKQTGETGSEGEDTKGEGGNMDKVRSNGFAQEKPNNAPGTGNTKANVQGKYYNLL